MNTGCVDDESAQPFGLLRQIKASHDMSISFSAPAVNGRAFCLTCCSCSAECRFNCLSGVMFPGDQDIRQFSMHNTATVTFEPSKAKVVYGSITFNSFTVLRITNTKCALTIGAQR